ncbi:STAS domain-containing protein [Rhodanobacter sp. MP7CTX1]|uniref:STAS domain-containing protein n=1 Tax=Rhodanobacter sp. MP7CTX1 TaxID=2723084 RepID=UPI00161672E7|nr:phospholipid transport system transporter-binding protein [Rhodanobacter sp. MP7CTX1]
MTTAVEREVVLSATTPGTLAVSGVLSFDTAASALREIQAALAKGPVNTLDLAGVRHCDSAGLSCVLAVAAEAARGGDALKVINVPAGMQVLAQVCEVDRLLG